MSTVIYVFTIFLLVLQLTFPSHPNLSVRQPEVWAAPVARLFSPAETPTAVPKKVTGFSVRFHPDGPLYVGDQVSMEIIAPKGENMDGKQVEVQVDPPNGPILGPAKFGGFGIEGRAQATLIWAWNTSGFSPGEHLLQFSLTSGGEFWTEAVTLLPASDMPSQEADAVWKQAKSKYATIYYISGTAAERDLPEIMKIVDQQATLVSEEMGVPFGDPITITLLPRVLGNGGFANGEISLSYLDRDYMGQNFPLVLHHEMVHILDGRMGGDLRPSILIEGLAVDLSGGHFKPENLLPRAAALLKLPPQIDSSPGSPSGSQSDPSLGAFIPLATLTDNFYASQHEIGYIEAGALVKFMIQTWGWQDYNSFYRDIHPDPSGLQSKAFDNALQAHFGITLDELQTMFLDNLKTQNVSQQEVEDVRMTVMYYDTAREYQQKLDPSAYFRTAWLMDNKQMREKGIVADYLRHPEYPQNVNLELILMAADQSLLARRYHETEQLLISVQQALAYATPPVAELNAR